MKLDTKLQNGDIVEIMTRDDAEPDDEWLKFAVSGRAISKIKLYMKEQKYDDDTSNGIKLLKLGLSIFSKEHINDESLLNKICQTHYHKLSNIELEHEIGIGSIPVLHVIRHILNIDNKMQAMTINISKCDIPIVQDNICLALPGDDIMAHITRNGELHIHRNQCKQNRHIGLDNLTFVHIINDTEQTFLSKISLNLINRPGVFTKFTAIIGEKNINMEEISQESFIGFARVLITMSVHSLAQIDDLITTLSNLDYVENVMRT